MTFVIIVAFLSFPLGTAFADDNNAPAYPPLAGAGTAQSPYIIGECAQLAHVNEEPSASYLIIRALECNSVTVTPIENFSGEYFDGGNNNINSLRITDTSNAAVGLFRHVDQDSKIQNIVLNSSDTSTQGTSVDPVAGNLVAENEGNIHNISLDNTTIRSSGTVGGLVGINKGSISAVRLNANYIEPVSGTTQIFGGAIGINQGEVKDISVRQNYYWDYPVNGATCGGIVGKQVAGSISRAIFSGDNLSCLVTDNTGGIVGEVSGGSTISNAVTRTYGASYYSTGFKGAIVGNNPDGVDLTSTAFDSVWQAGVACDGQGNTQCNQVADYSQFFNPDSSFYNGWGMQFRDSDQARQGSTWVVDQWAYENTVNGGDYGSDYLPTINNSRLTKLAAPQIVSSSATPTTASFSWKLPESCVYDQNGVSQCYNNDASAMQWDIYVGQVPESNPGDQVNVTYNLLDSVPGTRNDRWTPRKYTATDLDPDTTYDFIIQGQNLVGEGNLSESIEIIKVPGQLSSPSEVVATPGSATIQWDDQSDATTGYVVEYKESNETAWSGRLVGSSTTTVSPLNAVTSYDFRVAAKNMRGAGLASDPITITTLGQQAYTISTCEQLQAVNNDLHGIYELTQDIDCSNSGDFNDGAGFIPLGAPDLSEASDPESVFSNLTGFAGVLEGNGHTISNIKTNIEGFGNGLFAYIDGGTVKNLNLDAGQVVGDDDQTPEISPDETPSFTSGGLSALASNATIDHVTSNIDIVSNTVDGKMMVAGGLIGVVIPSGYGASAPETNLSITNSSATGNTAGYVTGGIVGAVLPANLLSILTSSESDSDQIARMMGSRLNVTISDSTSSGELRCGFVCAGFVGFSAANLSLTDMVRTGGTGAFERDLSESDGSTASIIEMLGPISAGALGVSIPVSFNENTATLNIDNVSIGGELNGTATAGLVGLTGPSIKIDADAMFNLFNTDLDDFESIMHMESVLLTDNEFHKGFTVKNATISAANNCSILCTGVSLANLGYGEYDNINVEGDIVQHQVDASVNGETASMASMFGPLTSGFVGVNLPISSSNAGGEGLNISNSTVKADLEGTATSGLVLVSLPGISFDSSQTADGLLAISNFGSDGPNGFENYEASLKDQLEAQYGPDWDNGDNPAAVREYVTTMSNYVSNGISGFAGHVLSVISDTKSLVVNNTTVEGDISCSLLCGGAAGISLSRVVINGFHQLGKIVNDNTNFLFQNNPLLSCPIQITGGVVGSQLVFPAQISNTSVEGNITVSQSGDFPDLSIANIVDDLSSGDNTGYSDEGSYDSEGNYTEGDTSKIVEAVCATSGSFVQGTGAIAGSFISPLEISGITDFLEGVEQGTNTQWALDIRSTNNSGDITSNSPSATGGLVGTTFGETDIDSSSNSGKVTNSTFAEMFRTPIASAATGGLVGRSIGALSMGGDSIHVATMLASYILGGLGSEQAETLLSDITGVTNVFDIHVANLTINNSSSTGLIVSSNTAGGLVGTIENGATISKSFSTGNVFGVTTGGLIGSGFNFGSPFSFLDMFSKTEINNSYARGNIIASDVDDTFTFAGGLVGFMTHLGEFRINNSYATGDISVRNNSTDSRLIAGGFIGAELDLSVVTQLAKVMIEQAGTITTGDEEIDGGLSMVNYLGTFGLTSLTNLGLPLRTGFSVTNSFTTSSVPADTMDEDDSLLYEIASSAIEPGVTSGSMFGFAFTVPEQEWRDLITNVVGAVVNNDSLDITDQEALQSELTEQLLTQVSKLDWASPSQLAPNSFVDASATQAQSCANSLPSVANLLAYEMPKIMSLSQGDGSTDYYSLIPPIQILQGSTCGMVNTASANESYFKNNTAVAPLNAWDFGGVWYSHPDDYPTFVADIPGPDTHVDPPVISDPPPGTNNENPNTGGPGSFLPKQLTPASIASTFDRIKATTAGKPLTKVLPRVIEDTNKALKKDVTKLTNEKNESLGAKVFGILSATGMFLLKNLVTVLMLITIGALIWYNARKPKNGGSKKSKEKDNDSLMNFQV